MSFLSLHFAAAFGLLLLLLHRFPERTTQQRLLLAASYLFYGLWDWRFLALLFVLSWAVWWLGRKIGEQHSKAALVAGLVLCTGTLGIFKYLGFFVDSFCVLAGLEPVSLRLILPVGLSCYIFQAISYLCDVYLGKIVPVNLEKVLLYIGFFPQIVSGPIVKARDFLPQLERAHPITGANLSYGLQLFSVGLFKKVVIADRLGICVDAVFSAPAAYSGLSLVMAVFAFTIQLYCDFSGYSDMAVGVARCMGYDLGRNFNMPFLARNPSEFWNRWHISLSSWFREYVYIPLGGSRRGQVKTCRNLMVTMLLSGIWHGANWTFAVWGAMHGVASVVQRLWKRKLPTAVSRLAMFQLFSLSLIPFRAENMAQAWLIFLRIVTLAEGVRYISVFSVIYGGLILGLHLLANRISHGDSLFRPLNTSSFGAKVVICLFLLITFLFACTGDTAFLYAQF